MLEFPKERTPDQENPMSCPPPYAPQNSYADSSRKHFENDWISIPEDMPLPSAPPYESPQAINYTGYDYSCIPIAREVKPSNDYSILNNDVWTTVSRAFLTLSNLASGAVSNFSVYLLSYCQKSPSPSLELYISMVDELLKASEKELSAQENRVRLIQPDVDAKQYTAEISQEACHKVQKSIEEQLRQFDKHLSYYFQKATAIHDSPAAPPIHPLNNQEEIKKRRELLDSLERLWQDLQPNVHATLTQSEKHSKNLVALEENAKKTALVALNINRLLDEEYFKLSRTKSILEGIDSCKNRLFE
ncbi:MAG: flagellar motility protein MotE (MotC chaperone) [Chlamydiales bacterium]